MSIIDSHQNTKVFADQTNFGQRLPRKLVIITVCIYVGLTISSIIAFIAIMYPVTCQGIIISASLSEGRSKNKLLLRTDENLTISDYIILVDSVGNKYEKYTIKQIKNHVYLIVGEETNRNIDQNPKKIKFVVKKRLISILLNKIK